MLFGSACRFESESEDFRVRRLPAGAAETLNSGLDEFVWSAWAEPKNRPAIGESGALTRGLRGEIGGQNGNLYIPDAGNSRRRKDRL